MLIFHLKLCCGVVCSFLSYKRGPSILLVLIFYTGLLHFLRLMSLMNCSSSRVILRNLHRLFVTFRVEFNFRSSCSCPKLVWLHSTHQTCLQFTDVADVSCVTVRVCSISPELSPNPMTEFSLEQPAPTVVNLPDVPHIFSKVANSMAQFILKHPLWSSWWRAWALSSSVDKCSDCNRLVCVYGMHFISSYTEVNLQ